MVVGPSITQCAPIVRAVADAHAGADHGCTARPHVGASSAAGSTMAVAWIGHAALGLSQLAHRAHQLGLGRHLAVDESAGLVLVDAGLARGRCCFQDQLVAGLDRPLEARVVDADEVHHHVVGDVLPSRLEGQQRRRLRQRLEHQHAGHHRPGRKVAGKKGSLMVTFFSALMRLSFSNSSTRSTSRNG
jgi:hypothetical protein